MPISAPQNSFAAAILQSLSNRQSFPAASREQFGADMRIFDTGGIE
jgi:hypothetical protein